MLTEAFVVPFLKGRQIMRLLGNMSNTVNSLKYSATGLRYLNTQIATSMSPKIPRVVHFNSSYNFS